MKIYKENVNVLFDQLFLQFVSKSVNNNLKITSVCSTLHFVIKLSHIQLFALHGMISFKETISVTEVFQF